ncbi:hypothetical protein [Bradyrhizobium sp. USDA 3256]
MSKPMRRTVAVPDGYALVRRGLVAAISVCCICGATAVAAKPPGAEAVMIRMITCDGEGVRMEVYLPLSVDRHLRGGQSVIAITRSI